MNQVDSYEVDIGDFSQAHCFDPFFPAESPAMLVDFSDLVLLRTRVFVIRFDDHVYGNRNDFL
jgi:hypothetical protein